MSTETKCNFCKKKIYNYVHYVVKETERDDFGGLFHVTKDFCSEEHIASYYSGKKYAPSKKNSKK